MKTQHIQDVIDMQEEVFEVCEIEKMLQDKKLFCMYEEKYTNKLYKTILKSLTHENYKSEEMAKKIFDRIIHHKDEMNEQLKRDVGIMVATIDYLSNIIETLDEPKIIEEDKSETLIETSIKDQLTNLFLRDIFDVTIKKQVDESNRTGLPLSLIMLDIDDFKTINDTFGHQQGDKVLEKIGYLLNENIREMDMAARYGGEELVILLPNTQLHEAFVKAQQIREDIQNLDFDGFDVTVSVGVSQTNDLINTDSKLIQTADYSMYQAKNNGKNRVETHKEA